MRDFQILGANLSGWTDPAIAIAASRAGAVGVLNLEYETDVEAARRALARISRYTDRPCGIILGACSDEFIAALAADLPDQFRTVILTPSFLAGRAAGDLSELVDTLRGPARHKDDLHEKRRQLLLTVTNAGMAKHAIAAGFDGLVAKGNEAGGWVGEETSFVLLQRLITEFDVPVWVQGGVGVHTAAACYVAGAAGVLLDCQLSLTVESSLPDPTKRAIAAMDGSETVCLGQDLDAPFRVYQRANTQAVDRLRENAEALLQEEKDGEALRAAWRRIACASVRWTGTEESVWVLGQAAAFARPLADQYRTVGGIIQAVQRGVVEHVRLGGELRPLDAGSPLAQEHGTAFPIVQGPMTRVSDKAEFALRVAEGGALPFLALALLREKEARELLEETQQLLGDRSWGVGILGFVPQELRKEQMDVIRQVRPPFALIAGGRPDQSLQLEELGIPTYLHVPSPGLLRLFLQDGARRFVFEGRECGGHVGPRSSFVLWETMIDVLLNELPATGGERYSVLFAGGIHNGLSAAMAATMAAPLAARGVRIGVLMGTAYLFTHEIVESGGINQQFQNTAIECDDTVLLESGPGHATRCVPTPFVDTFRNEKIRLQSEQRSSEEIRQALEELNVGRLRVAAKGITRSEAYGEDPAAAKYVTLGEAEQRQDGMYMIGQLASLRNSSCSISELHEDVSVTSSRLLEQVQSNEDRGEGIEASPSQIAIVGISTLLPNALNREQFWANILNKVSAIKEIPEDRWDADLYYDPDRNKRDKVYSRTGGFLDEIPFDPLEFGIPPTSLPSIDPMHLLALLAARDALSDAGYAHRPYNRTRTSVILGASGGTGDLGAKYLLRSGLPTLFGEQGFEIADRAGDLLPEWTEDSFAGMLLNVAAGRIANRLDLGGTNYVVDAACASSLAALRLAVAELETNSADVVIAGGVDTVQTPFGYLCFSKTQALSPTGEPRVFDASGDGIVISEGVVMLVLKRLADAERDGDRIYAVISAVAGSSDGKAMGMTAPRPEGQRLALERAYAKAGVSPTTVGLFEAHGTGTVVGDQTEAKALADFLQESGAQPHAHAIGSVKSMVGHTKATAGVTGVAKIAMALYHKVLPPTLGVSAPNPKAGFGDGPLYVNSETRPWIQGMQDYPRRAGVSAFGFGGSNFHAVLEEYTGDFVLGRQPAVTRAWPSELMLWAAATPEELLSVLQASRARVMHLANAELPDLSYTLWQAAQAQTTADSQANQLRLAIVASTPDDLRSKLDNVIEKLVQDPAMEEFSDPAGITLARAAPSSENDVAFLYPGQASQFPNMLRDYAIYFPEVREVFEQFDQTLARYFDSPLSSFVFPPPAFTPEEERRQKAALTETTVAQPALGAANMALTRLLSCFGIEPSAAAGHSYGEYAALCAAGAFDLPTLAVLSAERGRVIVDSAPGDGGTMAAVWSEPARLRPLLDSIEDVWIANYNGPGQTIISGTEQGISQALSVLEQADISAKRIPVACAFHSPLMRPAQDALTDVLSRQSMSGELAFHVYSNTTAEPYAGDAISMRTNLANQLVQPVRFADQVEAMYERGARVFVEVGPGHVLTNLVRSILGDMDYTTITLDVPGRNGITQWQSAMAKLFAHGCTVQLDRLFQGRECRSLNLSAQATKGEPAKDETTWLVSGGRVRPGREAAEESFEQQATLNVQLSDGDAVPKPATGTASVSDLAGQAYLQTSSTVSPVAASAEDLRSPESAPHRENDAPAAESAHASRKSGVGQQAEPLTHLEPANQRTQRVDAESIDEIMLQYQQTMRRFLETEQRIMVSYLERAQGSSQHTAPASEATAPAPAPETVGDQQEYARQAVVGETDTQQEEKFSEPSEDLGQIPEEQPDEPRPRVASVTEREMLTENLLAIVADRTGYPKEILKLDVDIEAEMGIDSIKRVEILGTLRRDFLDEHVEIDQNVLDELTSLRTLGAMIETLTEELQSSSSGAPAAASPEPTVATNGNGSTHPNHEEGQTRGQGDGANGAGATTKTASRSPASSGRNSLYPLLRGKPYLVDAPLESGQLTLDRDRTVLLTDDGMGVARAVQQRIQEFGADAILLSPDAADGQDSSLTHWDFSSATRTVQVVEEIRRRQGKIGGIVHLLPLRATPAEDETELSGWRDHMRTYVKSLFYLMQATAADLKSCDPRSPTPLVAATHIGSVESFGLGGLLKSAAQEWEHANSRVIRLPRGMAVPSAAQAIMEEMAARDSHIEIVRADTRRQAVRVGDARLQTHESPGVKIDSESVVLLTGGARGITAEVACFLAEQTRATLLLLGSSPLPDESTVQWLSGFASDRELKQALIQKLTNNGGAPSLSEVEDEFRRLAKQREISETLQRIQTFGSRVRYYQGDVRDEEQITRLINEAYAEFGKIDGVIYGAGLIEDKLIEDKTPESFDRVFDTKVDGAFLLQKLLRPELLKFLVFFASAAGTYGNRGQSDYAAANEVLNGLAQKLDAAWDARVVAINWGPWRKKGMVSSQLEAQFHERGIQLIPVAEGCRLLDQELRHGRKGENSIVIAGGVWGEDTKEPLLAVKFSRGQATQSVAGNGTKGQRTGNNGFSAHEPQGSESNGRAGVSRSSNGHSGEHHAPRRLPLLGRTNGRHAEQFGSVQTIYTLDLTKDRYLRDHRLDGKPVLPFAMAMELMLEVVQQAWPQFEITAVNDMQVLGGIVLQNGSNGNGSNGHTPVKQVHVTAETAAATNGQSEDQVVRTAILDPASGRTNYRATLELAPALSMGGRYSPPEVDSLEPLPLALDEAYRQWLFHGPLFQGIDNVIGLSRNSLAMECRHSSPTELLAKSGGGGWLFDPVLFDSALQGIILWMRHYWDATPLPSRFSQFRRYQSQGESPVFTYLRFTEPEANGLVSVDIAFVGPDDSLVGFLKGMECPASKALNRLGGTTQIIASGRDT